MIQDLEYLVQLQQIDLRIHEQEVAQEQYPAEVLKLEQEIAKAKSNAENIASRLEKTEKDLDNIEEQTRKAKDGLDRSQERLNNIKTNREYDAVHAEIEQQKNIVNNAESKTKVFNADIDKLKATLEQVTNEFERIKSENEPKLADLKAKIGAIDTTIAHITEEREVVLPKISKQLIRTYDQIRTRRKNGKALSLVTARTCTVCYKILEPQLINEVRRGLKLILCQNCGSILVHDDGQTKDQPGA